jgi:pimeloyl-ACP methyl ester carboxylesterase
MSQPIPHSDEASVKANGIDIAYDTFGDASAPPMLLIMGLGAQMIAWDEAFCMALAGLGYWVIRFDNRDVGHSTRFDEAGIPDLMAMMQGARIEPPYTLRDMAADAVGLLDALNIASTHVVGVSMGGMIAQEVAIGYPDRVRTLTSIMSSTGNPELPPASPDVVALLVAPAPKDREGSVKHSLQISRVLNGPAFPLDEERARELAAQAFDRGLSPAGTMRQLAAIIGSGSRKEALTAVQVPTLVIHGDADPLVPVEGGIDTAEAIPGAELLIIPGMGHNIPPAVAPQVIGAIVRHATKR